MATKEMVWNIEVESVPYKIEFKKNQVSVNGREPVKLNKLKKTGNTWVTNYAIPLQDKEATLHISSFAQPVLSLDGRDCSTGEVYEPVKVPGWVWVFIVLHALNFFLLIGGAIGGAIQALVIYPMISVAANTKKKTSTRVLTCLGMWLLSTVVQFFLALGIASMMA